MNNQVRELFETQVFPSFPGIAHGLRRKPSGEYVSDTLEDHWQTFQEGFEIAVLECTKELLKWKSEPFPLDPETAAKILKETFEVQT